MDMTTAVGVVACAAVALWAASAWQGFRLRARIRERMLAVDLFMALEEDEETLTARPVDDGEAVDEHAVVAFLDRRYPLAGGMRAGLAAIASAAVASVAGAGAFVFFGMPLLFALVGGLGLGALVGWNVGAFLEGGQRIRFSDRLLAAVDEFQRMVRFGMPMAEAFGAIAEGAEEPVQESLRRVRHSTGLGVPLAAALEREAHRVRVSELAMLAAIFATQAKVGGGLAESVGNLADMLRERKDNRARMKAATAESKLSLIVLSCVPFAAVGIQGATKPEIFNLLLGDARHLLGIGAGLVLLGLASAWLLVRRMQR